jgi:hypothetical protein
MRAIAQDTPLLQGSIDRVEFYAPQEGGIE